jgi:hypothetical protein
MSNAFGQSDLHGWYFAPSLDKLNEMIENNCASGVSTKTSITRKRRWVRNVICAAEELKVNIRIRCKDIFAKRINIETVLRDKENVFRSIKFYEENRSFVFGQSLHLATQGILNTLSVLKELSSKLKLLKQVRENRIFGYFLVIFLCSFFRIERN